MSVLIDVSTARRPQHEVKTVYARLTASMQSSLAAKGTTTCIKT